MLIRVAFVVVLSAISYSVWHSRVRDVDEPTHLFDVETKDLGPDIEFVKLKYDLASGSKGDVFVLYAKPSAISARITFNTEQKPIGELAKDDFFVMNAGFFTAEWRPTGLLVSEGHIVSPFVRGAGAAGSGVIVLKGDNVELFERDKLVPSAYEDATLAVQAGPRVIEEGGHPGIRSDDGAHANRTVIGRDLRGRLAIALVIGGPGRPPTLFELQQILGREGLGRVMPERGFACALNLDGGPSTGFSLRHAKLKLSYPEASPVQNVLSLRGRT